MRRRKLLAVLAALAVTLGAACGGDDTTSSSTASMAAPSSGAGPATTAEPVTGGITVFAAASLTDAFDEIGTAFEAKHPQANVTFNFAASSALVTQINEGAPADVFASADEANMKKLTEAGGNDAATVVFANNKLQIIVAKGNPKGIQSVEDLTDPNLLVVTAAPQVPIGAYAEQVFDKAGITVTPVSLEENVKAVVTKVTAGEADAGIVYSTDVTAAGDRADGVEIPDDLNVSATYPIAVTKDAPNPAGAAAFVDFVSGAEGQKILAGYGFDTA